MWILIGLGVLLLIGLVIGLIVYFTRRPSTPPTTQQPPTTQRQPITQQQLPPVQQQLPLVQQQVPPVQQQVPPVQQQPTNQSALSSDINGGVLLQDQRLTSPNGNFFLVMQSDGNLVIYSGIAPETTRATWWTSTTGQGSPPYHLVMQSDGNLVVYDGGNAPLWNSQTTGRGVAPYSANIGNDGLLTVTDGGGVSLWNNTQVPGMR